MTPPLKNKLEVIMVLVLFALGLGMTVTGCLNPAANTPSTALAPGYINAQDQTMGEVLGTAHGIVGGLLQQATSGSFVPTATEKLTINSLVGALNVADAAYQGYHAGTVTEAQAAIAVSAVQTQQQLLQAQMGTGGK